MRPAVRILLVLILFVSARVLGASPSDPKPDPNPDPSKLSPKHGPKRIVALSPVLTEILFSLGAGDQIVGTTTNSDHPVAAKAIARVGDYSRPVLEKILMAKPDLLLIQNEGTDNISPQLRKLSAPIAVLSLRQLSDYPIVVSKLGDLVQKRSEAQRRIGEWTAAWTKIAEVQSSSRPFRFLIQLDRAPLIIAGGDTFVSQAFESCGGTNVGKSLKGYPTIQREWLTKAAPDVMISLVHGTFDQPRVDSSTLKTSSVKAMTIKPDINGLSRLGPELPKHVMAACLQIQAVLRASSVGDQRP